jgi:hypothetical protein
VTIKHFYKGIQSPSKDIPLTTVSLAISVQHKNFGRHIQIVATPLVKKMTINIMFWVFFMNSEFYSTI